MTNVDYAEIAKFEALASRWWDKSGEFKPLHDINPFPDSRINARLVGKVTQWSVVCLDDY